VGVITERWRRSGSYAIDFTVGQSFGERQVLDDSVFVETTLVSSFSSSYMLYRSGEPTFCC
jgi:hypothetical protein